MRKTHILAVSPVVQLRPYSVVEALMNHRRDLFRVVVRLGMNVDVVRYMRRRAVSRFLGAPCEERLIALTLAARAVRDGVGNGRRAGLVSERGTVFVLMLATVLSGISLLSGPLT